MTSEHDSIKTDYYELQDIISNGSRVPTKTIIECDIIRSMPKARKEYNDVDRKAVEKNFKAKQFLVCCIGPYDYNVISVFETTWRSRNIFK